MYYISIRQRNKSLDQMFKHLRGPEFSDSLLHSLSSGLWAQTELRMPISFSPFLPFRASGESHPRGWLFLFIKNRKYFPVRRTHKLVNRYCNIHFISAVFQNLYVTDKSIWITGNINNAFHI